VLLVAGIVMVASLAGCGSTSIRPGVTPDFEQADLDQWNAYTRAAREQYRQAFELCNYWVTTGDFDWTVGPTEAADFFIAHDRFDTPLGAGCGDGIANTPLTGSGVAVPP
jgi:hypothetical protein